MENEILKADIIYCSECFEASLISTSSFAIDHDNGEVFMYCPRCGGYRTVIESYVSAINELFVNESL